MTTPYATPWHRASFETFLNARLPELLAARLPLTGYHAEAGDGATCRVRLAISTDNGELACEYILPQPDATGLICLDNRSLVVVPVATSDELDSAEILCIGEQLAAYIAERLGQATEDLPWDVALLRSWCPLDSWMRAFLLAKGQVLDATNWLARQTHLRRLLLPDNPRMFTPAHFGRTCPYETPEGPNVGKVLSIALGAAIRDGRLVIVDDRPEASLGLSASMIPFLEHTDTIRALMGVNMMRQWVTPPDPEPALVQTGHEPAAADFWCGRNLLTAYMSLGIDTYEDAIVISESCARRLGFPHPVEPGDKLSNRHGVKGMVSRILPDDEMPHLADGTAVELVFSFIGFHTRMNIGQLREAVMGRIARQEGREETVPPFHAPKSEELQQRLRQAQLPENGMEHLTLGRHGAPLPMPTTVGWVYWGKTLHLAQDKLHYSITPGRSQRQGDLEYFMLRDAGAFATILETFNTRAAERADAETLAARAAAGPVPQAAPPTPQFINLARRLAVAGIQMELTEEQLTFRFGTPAGEVLQLAALLPHPWLPEQELQEIGVFPELPEYKSLSDANTRLARLMESGAPASLAGKAQAQLEAALDTFFAALLPRGTLRFGAGALFSGRTVISPGESLRTDQVGLPEELAWALFTPLVTRELGDASAALSRDAHATRALDAIMARTWVILNRAPSLMTTNLLAFHPVRCEGRAIRINPLVCMPQNADFDGDQMAVFLPVTVEGQQEAGEKLSFAGQLRRDPSLVQWVFPKSEATWGLAWMSLTEQGYAAITSAAGREIPRERGIMTRQAVLDTLRAIQTADGAEAMLEAANRLTRLGFMATRDTGASISPFFGATLSQPIPPASDDPAAWSAYQQEFIERLLARTDFANPDFGPQLLASICGARGGVRQLQALLAARQVYVSLTQRDVAIRRGFVEGITPEEMLAIVVGAREGLSRCNVELARMGYGVRAAQHSQACTVLSRAMRAEYPGIVFAHAAANGETDPLTDIDSRLFVGLPPR